MEGTNEMMRRSVHFAAGIFAFLLAYLAPAQAVIFAAGAVLFNALILPRIGGSRLFRERERESPWRSGILIYPVSVLLLLLLFGFGRDGMAVAASGWIVMAWGDPSAAAWGRRRGRRPIPWNERKTIEGTLAFALVATAGIWLVLTWMGRSPSEAGRRCRAGGQGTWPRDPPGEERHVSSLYLIFRRMAVSYITVVKQSTLPE